MIYYLKDRNNKNVERIKIFYIDGLLEIGGFFYMSLSPPHYMLRQSHFENSMALFINKY